MGRFAREDVLAVLHRFEVAAAERATDTDTTEEIILLAKDDYDSVDVRALTLALMDVLPHTKVWVIEKHPHVDGANLSTLQGTRSHRVPVELQLTERAIPPRTPSGRWSHPGEVAVRRRRSGPALRA